MIYVNAGKVYRGMWGDTALPSVRKVKSERKADCYVVMPGLKKSQR